MSDWISRLLRPDDVDERRAAILAWMIVIQAICALFFVGDVIFDLRAGDGQDTAHLLFETVVAAVLVLGLAAFIVELRRLLLRMETVSASLRAVRGEMADLIETFFSDWGLTPAERDVAYLILKGFDNERIASFRGRAVGTIRAQSAAIYAKAGVDGRSQFISLFVEELLADDA